MSLTTDVQAHVDAIATAVATAMATKVTAYPQKYSKDRLGMKLCDDIIAEVRVVQGTRSFANLNQA